MILSFGILGLAVAFLIFVGVTDRVDTMLYPIGLSAFLAAYWVVSDVLPVFWMKIFDQKTEEQKRSYWLFAVMDAAGLAGLAYFILDMNSTIGVIVYVACTILKKRFRDEFLGKKQEEEEE